MQPLPVGIQTFRKIREEGFLYIDKTQKLHGLLNLGGYFFLSRPRRFGKSLLLSTIKDIFQGNKELFEGLWIENNWDWSQSLPVLHLGFSSIDYRGLGLEAAIMMELQKQARSFQISLESKTVKLMFEELLEQLHANFGKVVLLIDEYDKPLIDFLGPDIDQALVNQQVLKSFYSVVKDADPHLRFLLITGVSKFSKVSIFSDLNNLHDLSLDTDFSDLLGITQEELERDFAPYFEKLMRKNGLSQADMLDKVKDWYNGYSWDGLTFVYNPFSTLSLFQTGDFHNYWFETGTPTFLIDLMKEENTFRFERIKTNLSGFSAYDIDHIRLLPLLFQTGYLTIKEKGAIRYLLDYPNKEVRESMYQYILGQLMHKDPAVATNPIIDMYDAFANHDIETLMDHIKGVFARIPYDLFIANQEAYYHSLLFLTFEYLGIYANAEVHTNRGRIDAVVQTEKDVYVMEFKLDESAQAALGQIQERKYYERFVGSGKLIHLLGINFSSKLKSVDDWEEVILG
ncbi:MAG: ATP-binding protein [Bacteroidia bacterium]|nr:ATP-binding protein [Bacteroidia bacterium]